MENSSIKYSVVIPVYNSEKTLVILYERLKSAFQSISDTYEIIMVDEFVIYDDAQYTKRDWRNRNKIKSPKGLFWQTIPVSVKRKFPLKIKDTLITDPDWKRRHWETIRNNYRKSSYFKEYHDIFEELYLSTDEKYLSKVNYRFCVAICDMLNITTKITCSMDYTLIDGKTERLVDLCKQTGATEYISGPAARNYLDEKLFRKEGITLIYIDYSGYPEYRQLFPPFEHKVSIIDLIFNVGLMLHII